MAPQQVQQQVLSANQLQSLLRQQALLLQQQHLKEFYKKHQQQIQMQLLQQHPNKTAKELLFQQLLQLQQQLLGVQKAALPCSAPSTVVHQLWKELINGIKDDKNNKKNNLDLLTNAATPSKTSERQTNNQHSSPPLYTEYPAEADGTGTHVLYSHGVCNWPGCESTCQNISQFFTHMTSEHALDDRSTAQCRVQMQVVQQLDLQLSKERERLRAMMEHLHPPPLGARTPAAPVDALPSRSDTPADPYGQQPSMAARVDISKSLPSPSLPELAPMTHQPPPFVGSPSRGLGEVRTRHRAPFSSLSSEDDFELYRNTDIRPPFTYATLIRQAIMEAPEMQLTLNEIYNWFTSTFAYFRRNAATWKNAVRHNLSLHKCFVRIENVKGAVWTVDEVEYHRRRSQKITGSSSLIKQRPSSLALGSALSISLQTSVAETTLPGLHQDCTSRGLVSHSPENRGPDSSSQVQQTLFLKEEALSLEEVL